MPVALPSPAASRRAGAMQTAPHLLASAAAQAAIGAVAANAVVRTVAVAAFGVDDAWPRMAWLPVVAATVLGVLAATAAYAALERVSTRPARDFTLLAVVVLLLSLNLPLRLVNEAGASLAGVASLASMHLVVAILSVTLLTRAARLGEAERPEALASKVRDRPGMH